jgi:hypothetical protein
MQCPTCGRDTPGTLDRCVRCDAPVIQQAQEAPVHEPQRFEAPADPQSGPAPAHGPPEAWTSDSEAIARWAATPAFSNTPAPEPWPASPPAQQQPAAEGPPSAPEALDDWYTKPETRSTAPQPMAPRPSPPPQRPPAQQRPPAFPAQDPQATQAWAAQEPARPASPPAPHRPADPEATQAWSMEPAPMDPAPMDPAPPAGPAWPGADDRTPRETHEPRPAESVVPDSWFTETRPAEPEATERWTPSPGPAEPDPWAAGPAQPWGPEPHGGQSWGPDQHTGQPWGHNAHGGHGHPQRNETAVLAADYPPDYPPPGHGPGYGPMEQRRGRAGKPLIFVVTALVVAAVVAVAFVMWPKGDGSTAGGPTPAAAKSPANDAEARPQAVAINSLLNASAASRNELGRALAAAKLCRGLPTAIAGMQEVAKERQQQLTRARALQVDGLQNGTQLRSHLARSIQYSLEVDEAYLAWAQSESQNPQTCRRAGGAGPKRRPRPDANYQRGGQLSNQASVSKRRFATLWAPVAKKHRLPPRTANQF